LARRRTLCQSDSSFLPFKSGVFFLLVRNALSTAAFSLDVGFFSPKACLFQSSPFFFFAVSSLREQQRVDSFFVLLLREIKIVLWHGNGRRIAFFFLLTSFIFFSFLTLIEKLKLFPSLENCRSAVSSPLV